MACPTQAYIDSANSIGFNIKTTAGEVAAELAPHIRDKVILTTGVSPGSIGAAFLQAVAAHGPRLLILAARDLTKARSTAETIYSSFPSVRTRILELDLSSQSQIRKAAKEVLAYEEPIDVLVNNAGIMASPYGLTADGIERQFGTNHIGHFLFTNLIMGRLLAAGPGTRVVNVSSDGYRLDPIRFDDLGYDNGKTYSPFRAYGQSKTANMLFSVSLAQKLSKEGILSFSLHPGAIPTNLGRHMAEKEDSNIAALNTLDAMNGAYQGKWKGFPWKTLQQGAATHVVAAFGQDLDADNGGFLLDCKILPKEWVRCWGRDSIEAERLWKVSEELVGEKFSY